MQLSLMRMPKNGELGFMWPLWTIGISELQNCRIEKSFLFFFMLRSHIHEYGHGQNRHVMFITIEYIKNRNLKNT